MDQERDVLVSVLYIFHVIVKHFSKHFTIFQYSNVIILQLSEDNYNLIRDTDNFIMGIMLN
jgi:hypothetical protein